MPNETTVRLSLPCTRCGQPAASVTLPAISQSVTFAVGTMLRPLGITSEAADMLAVLNDPDALVMQIQLVCATCEGDR